MKNISFGHMTDVGCKRDHNEDNFASHPDLGLWVVADGMGGYEAGEVASAIAVQTIVENVRRGMSLKSALEDAHSAILEAVESGQGSRGMGTTCIALQLKGPAYEIAWVGDSRAYLFSKKLIQLSKDHSFVQYMLDKGAITAKEAKEHPRGNEISQALGAAPASGLKVDTIKGSLCRNEKILLCSDGLYGEMSDDTIRKIVKSSASDQDKIERLVHLARDHGGSDNITAILVSAPLDALKKPLLQKGSTIPFNAAAFNQFIFRRKLIRWALVLLIVVTAISMAWWGIQFFGNDATEVMKG